MRKELQKKLPELVSRGVHVSQESGQALLPPLHGAIFGHQPSKHLILPREVSPQTLSLRIILPILLVLVFDDDRFPTSPEPQSDAVSPIGTSPAMRYDRFSTRAIRKKTQTK